MSRFARDQAVSPREVAAEWLEWREQGVLSAEEEARLAQWLEADGGHRAAYDEMSRVYALADDHAADPQILGLRQAALAARPASRRPIWGMATAAGLAVTLGLAWSGISALGDPPSISPSPIARLAEALSASADPRSAVHRTRVGERLALTLPDGSVATLNTDSILKVAYRDGERGVRLVRGQALFEVAKNKAVPFRVYAGDRQITAVGTVFDVRLDGDRVKVALVEGVVKVASAKAHPEPGKPTPQVELTAGEVLEAAPAAPMRVVTADTARSISWRTGVVEFAGEPLGQAVAEMNRYTTRPIELADGASASYRISGVFRTGDPDQFARMMTQVFPLEAQGAPDGPITLRRKD